MKIRATIVIVALTAAVAAPAAAEPKPSSPVEEIKIPFRVTVPAWVWEARPGVYPGGKPISELADEDKIAAPPT